jgi:hypothetical protein
MYTNAEQITSEGIISPAKGGRIKKGGGREKGGKEKEKSWKEEGRVSKAMSEGMVRGR